MNNNSKSSEGDESNKGSVYYFNLLNMFIKYYNDKYDKNEHFFSSIKDNNKDTSTQMEMFYEMIIEYNTLKNNTVAEGTEDTESILGNIYKEGDSKICDLLNDSKYEQVYCLELPNKEKIYTLSLLLCLNYIIDNNNCDITCCKIYFLK